MIVTRRSKTNPKDADTVAVCDRCEVVCEKSRTPGWRGNGPANAAEKAALEAGWKEHLVKDTNPRRRKMAWTVELLCPGCASQVPTASGEST